VRVSDRFAYRRFLPDKINNQITHLTPTTQILAENLGT
jgi:hypothetical protein